MAYLIIVSLLGYIPGNIENSAKTQVFFTILDEAVKCDDRLLVFSQSRFTLDLLEELLEQRFVPGNNPPTFAMFALFN